MTTPVKPFGGRDANGGFGHIPVTKLE